MVTLIFGLRTQYAIILLQRRYKKYMLGLVAVIICIIALSVYNFYRLYKEILESSDIEID